MKTSISMLIATVIVHGTAFAQPTSESATPSNSVADTNTHAAAITTADNRNDNRPDTIVVADHLFPRAGGSLMTIATGIPYVSIAEYAYGITDRLSIGVMGGTTPKVPGYGIRVRGVLYQRDDQSFRVYARAPVLYYPETRDLGGEPWLLTWPIAAAEWRTPGGIQYSVSAGMVLAACAESLFGVQHEGEARKLYRGSWNTAGARSAVGEEMGFEGGVWNTAGAGIAMPIGDGAMIQAEASVVLSGLEIASSDEWVGGPSTIVIIGLTRPF